MTTQKTIITDVDQLEAMLTGDRSFTFGSDDTQISGSKGYMIKDYANKSYWRVYDYNDKMIGQGYTTRRAIEKIK